MRLLELDLAERPEDPWVLLNLGRLSLARQATVQAGINYLRKCLEHCPRDGQGGDQFKLQAYLALAVAYGNGRDRQRQLHAYQRANELFPGERMVMLQLGRVYEELGDLPRAGQYYEQVLTSSRVNVFVFQQTDALSEAALRLGGIYQRMGQPERAEAVYRQCCQQHPDQWQVRRRLAELCILGQRADEAQAHVDRLPSNREAEPIRLALRGCVAILREDWPRARSDLLTSYNRGYRDPMQLHGLSVALLALGETKTAEQVLLELLELAPRHEHAARNLDMLYRQTGQLEKAQAFLARLKR